jgi:filamentous hemagglutinin family protein
VNIAKPNADAIALNRVVGVDPSLIYGSLSAN